MWIVLLKVIHFSATIETLRVSMTPDQKDALCDVPINSDGMSDFKLVWQAVLSNLERGYISPSVRAQIELGMLPTPKGYTDPFPEKTNLEVGKLLMGMNKEHNKYIFTFPSLPASIAFSSL